MSRLDEGALFEKLLDDGREMVVYPMLFNDRICIGIPGMPFHDQAWCVPRGQGVDIAKDWDGEGDPPNFIKQVGTDRYGPGS